MDLVTFLGMLFYGGIIVITVLYINHKNKNRINNPPPVTNKEVEKKPVINTKEYKIAGVTFENEDNKNIQTEIKKILKEYQKEGIIEKDELFSGYSNAEIIEGGLDVYQYEDIPFTAKMKQDIFEGKPCIKVYILRADYETYTHIGYIQKRYNQIDEVIDIMNNYDIISSTLYVVGGKMKSCEINDDGDDFVEITELDYGLRLVIRYKDKDKDKNESERN